MNFLKMMGSLGKLAAMQGELKAMQAEIARQPFTRSVDAGRVTVTVNGAQEMTACTIAPELLSPTQADRLQMLLCEAVTAAVADSKRFAADATQKKMQDALDMPELAGIFEALMPKR
ncbi:MAG: YbaB/EbfC family nucleoid-associated protein [Planctomycetia bacterium]